MPRKSASAISTPPPVRLAVGRLPPPPDLAGDAARVWRDIVSAEAPERFRASDGPLLRSYCAATVLAEQSAAVLGADGAYTEDGKLHPALLTFEKASKVQASLAMRLRLCPSARLDQRGAGRAPAGPGPVDFTGLRR